MRAFASGGKCDEFERRKTNDVDDDDDDDDDDWEKCTLFAWGKKVGG